MSISLELTAGLDQVLHEQEGAFTRRSILPGGVRLLTERDPGVRSASVGFWLPVGSRDEKPEHAGSTHFLEHLLFKGTPTRSALDIARAFDEVGGESNAVTAKEHTCYYARVRSVDLPMALATLADMVTSASITSEAFTTEREVILEELAMAEDDPTDVGHEALIASVLGEETALGRPVGGTPATINAVTVEAVREHHHAHYLSTNLVVTAVGDVDHDEVATMLLDSLAKGGWSLSDGQAPRPRRAQQGFAYPSGEDGTDGLEALRHGAVTKRLMRETEQTHLFLGGPAIPAWDERRHSLSVAMAILGGGMSSRLFQEVREKRGLAYSVYGFTAAYRDAGLAGLYAACRPMNAEKVAQLLLEETQRLATDGIEREELARTLGHISGSMALSLEDTQSRMARLATAELVLGSYRTVDEALEAFHGVTRESVREIASEVASALRVRVDVGRTGAA